MKDFLTKLLTARNARIAEVKELIKNSASADEVRSLGAELDTLNVEVREIQKQLDALDAPAAMSVRDTRGMNPLGSFTAGAPAARAVDPHDTPEYREAFMNFVCRGVPIPMELREDAQTTTTTASAVIPTTLMTEIIRKMESYGNLYSLVRKINVQGGVEFPVLSVKPTASWITETAVSDTQAITANTKVSFSYYGLECRISQTLLSNVVSYDVFNNMFAELATEAIVKALEVGIINGSGSGQMTGIVTKLASVTAQNISLSPTDFTSWSAWKKQVFAKIPKAYQNGIFVMAQGTFDGYIDGMVDSTGQPIARVNYGIEGGMAYRFGGKRVETVEESVIKSYDTATAATASTAGDVVAVYFNPTDYCINSNLQLQIVKWTDNDSNEVKTKAILICDGKPLDTNGMLLIRKGKAS